MEFFEWINVPQMFISSFSGYFVSKFSDAASAAAFQLRIYIICLAVAAVLYVSGLVFGGIGLSTMAKKRGLKHSFLAFLPLGDTYYTGKFAEDCNVFGKKVKRIGLICMLLEVVFIALQIFSLVVSLMIYSNPAYYTERTVVIDEETKEMLTYFAFDENKLTGAMFSLALASNITTTIASVWWFVLLFFFCAMFNAVFRKYYARSPFLMTFLCAILPCRGYVLFAVRNNTPIDYNEYMRKRMEEERRRYQGDFGGYGGGGGAPRDDSPFPDFDGTKGSGRDDDGPFSDYK